MFHDHSPLQAAGQLLLALAFLATGVRNAGWKFAMHAERMATLGIPWSRAVLSAGLALQLAGSLLLLADYRRALGAWLLIAFTVVSSAIFHRWWLIPDPLVRHLHIASLLVNFGLVGGLLWIAAF